MNPREEIEAILRKMEFGPILRETNEYDFRRARADEIREILSTCEIVDRERWGDLTVELAELRRRYDTLEKMHSRACDDLYALEAWTKRQPAREWLEKWRERALECGMKLDNHLRDSPLVAGDRSWHRGALMQSLTRLLRRIDRKLGGV